MDDDKRREVETCICSVLTSNPLRMTVKDLDKQFRDIIGYRIPFGEFGYNSLESYLRSMPHRVFVNGSGYNAEVRVLLSDKSAHIDAMISKQRVAKTSKSLRSGLRRNVTIREQRWQCNGPAWRAQPQSHSMPALNNSPKPAIPSLLSLPCKPPGKPEMRSPQNNVQTERVPDPAPPVSHVAENYRRGVIPKTLKKSPIPNYIQSRLKQIITKYPEGVHCNQLPDLYKTQFRQDLNFFDYGYKSVAQLCMHLSGIFTHQRLKDSSVKVFDRDLGIEVEHEPLEPVKTQSWTTPTKNTEPALPADIENVLLNFHLTHLEKDVVTDANIIRQWIGADIGIEDYIDLVVAEVHDPSKFWIHLRQYAEMLDKLMDQMQLFYRNKKGLYDIPYYAIEEDMYLVCIFDSEYHRAKVIDGTKKKDGTLKVYYIDYGTVAVVETRGVCYLVEEFVSLPAQAIRARLYGIQPMMRDSAWPRSTASRFLNLVSNKALVGQVYDVDEEEMILDLIIADTSDPDRDFFVNDALVHEGLAIFVDEEMCEPKPRSYEPTVLYVYLYPTHKEFETGLAPTYQAMLHLEASNITYDKIFPKYFRRVESPIENDQESWVDKLKDEEENQSIRESLTSPEEIVGKPDGTDDEVSIVVSERSDPVMTVDAEINATAARCARPPPGINCIPGSMPDQNRNSCHDYTPISPPDVIALLANSIYYANIIAAQAMINTMCIENTYNPNHYPSYYGPMPSNHSVQYNGYPYGTVPPPSYNELCDPIGLHNYSQPYNPAFYHPINTTLVNNQVGPCNPSLCPMDLPLRNYQTTYQTPQSSPSLNQTTITNKRQEFNPILPRLNVTEDSTISKRMGISKRTVDAASGNSKFFPLNSIAQESTIITTGPRTTDGSGVCEIEMNKENHEINSKVQGFIQDCMTSIATNKSYDDPKFTGYNGLRNPMNRTSIDNPIRSDPNLHPLDLPLTNYQSLPLLSQTTARNEKQEVSYTLPELNVTEESTISKETGINKGYIDVASGNLKCLPLGNHDVNPMVQESASTTTNPLHHELRIAEDSALSEIEFKENHKINSKLQKDIENSLISNKTEMSNENDLVISENLKLGNQTLNSTLHSFTVQEETLMNNENIIHNKVNHEIKLKGCIKDMDSIAINGKVTENPIVCNKIEMSKEDALIASETFKLDKQIVSSTLHSIIVQDETSTDNAVLIASMDTEKKPENIILGKENHDIKLQGYIKDHMGSIATNESHDDPTVIENFIVSSQVEISKDALTSETLKLNNQIINSALHSIIVQEETSTDNAVLIASMNHQIKLQGCIKDRMGSIAINETCDYPKATENSIVCGKTEMSKEDALVGSETLKLDNQIVNSTLHSIMVQEKTSIENGALIASITKKLENIILSENVLKFATKNLNGNLKYVEGKSRNDSEDSAPSETVIACDATPSIAEIQSRLSEKDSNNLEHEPGKDTADCSLTKSARSCDNIIETQPNLPVSCGQFEVFRELELTNGTHITTRSPSESSGSVTSASTTSLCEYSANERNDAAVEVFILKIGEGEEGVPTTTGDVALMKDQESKSNATAVALPSNAGRIRVSLQRIGGIEVHVITMSDGEKYLMLQEISLHLLGSLRTEAIRRKIAVSPYLIDIDDVLLDRNPELAAELAANRFISDTHKIDIVNIQHVSDLVKALSGNVLSEKYSDFVNELNAMNTFRRFAK